MQPETATTMDLRAPARWIAPLLAGCLTLLGSTGHVRAQDVARFNLDRVDLELWQPSASATAWAALERPSVASHLTATLGLFASYSRGLLRIEREGETQPFVSELASFDLTLALALFQAMEVGVVLPLRYVNGPSAERIPDSSNTRFEDFRIAVVAGDPRVTIKAPLVSSRLLEAGLQLGLSLPVGQAGWFVNGPRYVLSPTILGATHAGPLELRGSLGYWLRQEQVLARGFEVDDELVFGLGARVSVGARMGVGVESHARIAVASELNEVSTPAEIRAVWDAEPAARLHVFVGLGRGISLGYGTPAIRAFAGARYSFEKSACDWGPEDYDGFEDGDFCREPDNDEDGVLDLADACPNDSEDADGFVDSDGCPDSDNDADGIHDHGDGCPLVAEDLDGIQDADGCPEEDNDSDSIVDFLDDCPMDPEDADHFEDDDGCPEPGPSAAVVTVTDTRLLISERIYFDYDRDTIRPVSLPLLDQVAEVLQNTPRIRMLRIEGYTDSSGAGEYNLDLSYRRARSVLEYLASKEVARDRLSFIGFGENNPVSSNDSPEGQALNRRVEFTIVESERLVEPRRPAPRRLPPRPARSGQ